MRRALSLPTVVRVSARPFPAVLAVSVAALAGLVAAPAGAVAGAAAGSDGACARPPTEITVLPGPIGTTGPTQLAVADAVARRVPIVPVAPDARRDAASAERLRAKAARTDLALYTMYLADFAVSRKELRGGGYGEVTAPAGSTVVAVTVVPTAAHGFRAGDVAEVAPFTYESTTTFAPVSLVTNSSGIRSAYAYDGVTGGIEIRELGAKSICLAMDVTFTRAGKPIASAVGTVEAPVVRAAPSFFYT